MSNEPLSLHHCRYIIRACFSQERMTYLPAKEILDGQAKVVKIYQIDPLLCPKCQGPMKIISFIEDDTLIKKILMHRGLWDIRLVKRSARRVASNHDPPSADILHTPNPHH